MSGGRCIFSSTTNVTFVGCNRRRGGRFSTRRCSQAFRNLEDVSNLGVAQIALGSLLELMYLLHLKVLHGANVSQQTVFSLSGEFT